MFLKKSFMSSHTEFSNSSFVMCQIILSGCRGQQVNNLISILNCGSVHNRLFRSNIRIS